MNFTFGRLVRVLSSYEMHETYTKYYLSVALKLTFTRFINTGVIPLAVHFSIHDWFSTSGLATDVFVITIAISFFAPLIDVFEPIWLYNKLLVYLERKKGENSKMTQAQANKLCEGPPIDLPQMYCDTYLLLMVCFFYASLVPVISIICLFGVIYQYWLEKYLLLRRYKIPEEIGKEVAVAFTRFLPFCMFLYALGMFIFIGRLSEWNNSSIQFPLLITAAYLILPVRILFNF